MPVIFPTADGIVGKQSLNFLGGAYDDIRAGDTYVGDSAFSNTGTSGDVFTEAGLSGLVAYLQRAILSFDTSGITATPQSATLNIKGSSHKSADLIVISATLADSSQVQAADFWNNSTANSATAYSSEIEMTSWSTSGYNTITLNAAALSQMTSADVFTVGVVGHDYDHDYSDPGATTNFSKKTRLILSDTSGTSQDPYLDYTEATTGLPKNLIINSGHFHIKSGKISF
jgi:hypothetical protein